MSWLTLRSAGLERASHEAGFGEYFRVGDAVAFGGGLGQSEDGAYAHGKRGNGGEDGLELHGWAGEGAFLGNTNRLIPLMRLELIELMNLKAKESSDVDSEEEFLEETCSFLHRNSSQHRDLSFPNLA